MSEKDNEIKKLKLKIIELRSLTSLSAQKRLQQTLRKERRAINKPLGKKHRAIARVLKRFDTGHLALDTKTLNQLREAFEV